MDGGRIIIVVEMLQDRELVAIGLGNAKVPIRLSGNRF